MSINAMQLPAINTQVQNDETFLLASKKPSNDTKKTSVGLDVLITTTQGIASIFFACAVYKAIFSKTTDGVFGPNSVFFAYYMVALVLDHSANKLNRTTAATLKSLYFDHQLSRNFHCLNSSNYPLNSGKYPLNANDRLHEQDMQLLTNLNTPGFISTLSSQEREKFQSSVALAIGRREQQEGSGTVELHRMCYKSVFGEDIKQ